MGKTRSEARSYNAYHLFTALTHQRQPFHDFAAHYRNLNTLLTLGHSHQVLWNQHFDFHSAFQCNPKEAITKPPPTSRQFRKRKVRMQSEVERSEEELGDNLDAHTSSSFSVVSPS